MNDVKKSDAMTPEVILNGLANICGNLSPVYIPPPSYSGGMIHNFVKKHKVRQIRLIMDEVRLIEESRTATLLTQLQQAKSITFYSDEIKTNQIQHETHRKIMQAQADKEIAIAGQEEIKRNIMFYEMKKTEMEYSKSVKEFEGEYGSAKTEDRN